MIKELKALENIKQDLEYITRLDYVEPVVRGEVRDNLFKIYHRELPELDIIEKAIKAFEIIKKYPRCSLQRHIGFNELVKNGYELTQEHLFSHDIPCSVEEYNIVIEVLLNEIHNH